METHTPPIDITAVQSAPLGSALNILAKIDEFSELHRLSRREKEILTLMTHAVTTASQIGERLGVTTHTVSNHFKRLLAKTQTENKTVLLATFLQHCFKME